MARPDARRACGGAGDKLTTLLHTALTLAAHGLHVFPCWPARKEPATSHGFLDATTDPDVIRQWWRHEPQFNVAVATGELSKIFVVDIDGLDAESELRKLEAEHGALPATVEAITGHGRHLYFKMPGISVRNSESRIAPKIDVRGSGGYALCPPSLHPSGKRYAWSVDSAKAFAAAPDWLLARIASAPTAAQRWRRHRRNGAP